MEIVNQLASPGKENRLAGLLDELQSFVTASAEQGVAAHEVEQGIWQHLLKLGRESLQVFFDRAGDGDLGETVELEGGRRLRRLSGEYVRPYQSIFGPFELRRAVYGTRVGQRIELVPLDQRLQLPESKFSYLLQDWDQRLVAESPYAEVSRTLCKILGFSQSVDSLERMNRKMSEPVVDYWDSLAPPPASEEGSLLVLSADGKGVPIRRDKGAGVAPGPAPLKGPKPGAKKMALLGASYTVDRRERTPEEVTESLFLKPAVSNAKLPGPQHKRLRASLARSESGSTDPAQAEIFGWLAMEAEDRNRSGTKPMIVLMDGQHSLWDAAQRDFPDGAIEILDLLHVTPRLWKAAYLFHPEGSASAAQFVRSRVLRILKGEVHSVVRGLRQMATRSGLTGRKRKQLERICQYFENHRSRMRYDEYLAAGYPIATGVIEGACRHVVKDRLERAGMQWVFEGAQAMLDLRTIHLSHQWDEFQAYRIKKEAARLYPNAGQAEAVEWPIAA
ncbi:MAG: ISKra4 family transposase, partial [bacterium]|nr:ISKra4 family transposase [bacterium]